MKAKKPEGGPTNTRFFLKKKSEFTNNKQSSVYMHSVQGGLKPCPMLIIPFFKHVRFCQISSGSVFSRFSTNLVGSRFGFGFTKNTLKGQNLYKKK